MDWQWLHGDAAALTVTQLLSSKRALVLTYLDIQYIPRVGELNGVLRTLVGASLGFPLYNAHTRSSYG